MYSVRQINMARKEFPCIMRESRCQKHKARSIICGKFQLTLQRQTHQYNIQTFTCNHKSHERGNDMYLVIKLNNCQSRLLYMVELSYKIDGKIKIFWEEEKLRCSMKTMPTLQKVLTERGKSHGSMGKKKKKTKADKESIMFKM